MAFIVSFKTKKETMIVIISLVLPNTLLVRLLVIWVRWISHKRIKNAKIPPDFVWSVIRKNSERREDSVSTIQAQFRHI